MSRLLSIVPGVFLAWLVLGRLASAEEPPKEPEQAPELDWSAGYAEAVEVAQREAKMVLIWFQKPGGCQLCDQFRRETLTDPEVAEKLKDFVKVKLPLDAAIQNESGEIVLLEHATFAEMLGRPGLAILDFTHKDAPYYGFVVSTFPVMNERPYTPREMSVILDLPPGTLTQRTLIYAVRTHPEGPASTQGKLDPNLIKEASLQAAYQARIHHQGHQNWDQRFHRINATLPPEVSASEVCAESWPGEHLLEAAIECVRCWRFSSGHWGAVRARHPVYGYDMKRGSNGIWYATGIFGRS
ncbi:MAG: thioredoxin family protein [Planctomycetota bacterium]